MGQGRKPEFRSPFQTGPGKGVKPEAERGARLWSRRFWGGGCQWAPLERRDGVLKRHCLDGTYQGPLFMRCPCLPRDRCHHASLSLCINNYIKNIIVSVYQFSSVAQSCPTLCDPMNCSTPSLPVHHHLSEFTHTPSSQ